MLRPSSRRRAGASPHDGRKGPPRQRLLPAFERSRRLDRRFKYAILALTSACLVGMIGGSSVGRYSVVRLTNRVVRSLKGLIGFPPAREGAEAEWRLKRAVGIERTARIYRDFFEGEAPPRWRRILSAAGMAPRDVLLRWANYDWTVVLSPKVFEADDSGRAYRMRPGSRAFWPRNHSLPHGLSCFFFLPDIPEVRSALAEANEEILPESFQATNSWGCRGPEPDLDARVRGLVLGDSFMQGLFVADDQTPPECLSRTLREAWDVPVSILNTGHLGYSPEQYYYTLREYFDRFRPHFVVLSVCPNDFGDATVLEGGGDFAEGKYWINAIQEFCWRRQVTCLLVPVPLESQVVRQGDQGHYPGRVSGLSSSIPPFYLNPVAAFTDENLRLLRQAKALGRRPSTSPLFNGHLEDGHFSALGSALWGREVGRRIALLLDPPPGPAPGYSTVDGPPAVESRSAAGPAPTGSMPVGGRRGDQYESALITSPLAFVPRASQVWMLIELLMNRTLPSAIVTLTPPGW